MMQTVLRKYGFVTGSVIHCVVVTFGPLVPCFTAEARH
jgi:hypothetical protein